MEKIGNYDVYHSSYYDKTVQSRRDAESARKTEAKGTGASQNKVALSSEAKNLLKELKKTYGSMDFIVADYETDEEAAACLSRGTGEYSVLITPEELEEMAADKDVKNENLKVLDEAVSKLDEMKKQLGDKADEISRIGIAIGSDGEISYFAELEKVGEKQRERIERQRADRRETAAEEAKKEEAKTAEETPYGRASAGSRAKRTVVYADSVEELSEKIAQVDWSAVKEEQPVNGNRFDFTV